MIKLNDIETKVLEIEIEEGNIKRYDLIDLAKSLSEVIMVDESDSLGSNNIENIDCVKKIFDIDGLTGSQAMGLLEEVMVVFDKEFGDVKEIAKDDVKKKQLEERVTSPSPSEVQLL
ncbi:MAG: hypothetical protein KOO65_08550 [Desulfobacterales bacterium]|nr:hypothetical protein [Desulfobacterales bacterium]